MVRRRIGFWHSDLYSWGVHVKEIIGRHCAKYPKLDLARLGMKDLLQVSMSERKDFEAGGPGWRIVATTPDFLSEGIVATFLVQLRSDAARPLTPEPFPREVNPNEQLEQVRDGALKAEKGHDTDLHVVGYNRCCGSCTGSATRQMKRERERVRIWSNRMSGSTRVVGHEAGREVAHEVAQRWLEEHRGNILRRSALT
jgi:hypothetical protein